MSETVEKNSEPGRFQLNPKIMYADVEEKKYKSELEVFDRWQSFSAEILRLSLSGIAVFGFLYQQVFSSFDTAKHPNIPIDFIKLLSQVSLVLFALATVCALFYRYGSTEAIMHYLAGLRNPLEEKSELETREWWLTRCLVVKMLSVIFLGLGSVLSAVAIFKLL